MTSDGILVLRTVFVVIWSLFTSFEIPGTHTTPAEFAVFSLALVLSLRLVKIFLSVDVSHGGKDE